MPISLHNPVLARYADLRGAPREIVIQPGCAGSRLVVDRDRTSGGEQRLIAHLAADEPWVNAVIACRDYLRNPNRWCRRLLPDDLFTEPLAREPVGWHGASPERHPREREPSASTLSDAHGQRYRLAPIARTGSMLQLRWQRLPAMPVRLRDVVGAIESYEPACGLTEQALASCEDADGESDAMTSTVVLRAELQRLRSSHIVLNRALREAVLAAIEREGLTLSEITARCGRFKHGAGGTRHGDTSWLARRIGLAAETGKGTTTPWVHSDVLALVAREGLGIAPREVELG